MCSIIAFTGQALTPEEIKPHFDQTISRGPDDSRFEEVGSGYMGFHRLAIMGLTPEGMQPFHQGKSVVVCNGEIYGFRQKEQLFEAALFSCNSKGTGDCKELRVSGPPILHRI